MSSVSFDTQHTADLIEALKTRLSELRAGIKTDPLRNPVRELAHEMSRELEARPERLETIDRLVDYLDKEAFNRRAEHVVTYLSDSGYGDADDPFTEVVTALCESFSDFDAFKAFWEHRHETVIFTGHPTFILSRNARQQLATNAMRKAVPVEGAGMPDSPITLSLEHEQAEEALSNASHAVSRLNRTILNVAKNAYPDLWKSLHPNPIGLGTWIGYDMDGRTDIGWSDVILHRLHEKQSRLALYVQKAAAIGAPAATVHDKLKKALTRCTSHLDGFEADLSKCNALTAAANNLTTDKENITSLVPLMEELDQLAAKENGQTALDIISLRSEMQAFGLGMGEIHFRLNASQIRNSAQALLGLSSEDDLFGRGALAEISKLIDQEKPASVNFGSLAMERSSSSRLFIAMAQILKHIDADSSIRLLIAECENAVTVLAAIYLAKRFGVDHKVDVCPLFETAMSLDRGRRILDVLFRQPAYRDQVKKRGRISIEAGFSDAGRFMGQIPAALAIERLHGQLADEMTRRDLNDLTAIIYDTHGESMGRGGHPGGIVDRCLYALSPWTRHQFADRKIGLCHEQSFQGGDGFVWFTTPELGEQTLCGILKAMKIAQGVEVVDDPFYRDWSASLDFFNAVKRRQEALFSDPAYNIALNAMGLSLLPSTGSRKNKRQFDRRADEETSLRRIRAIPHNAILQQMGYLANIIGGVGNAMAVEPEAFKNLYQQSDRFHRLMRLVNRARQGSEMKTLIAYMKLYDGSFWATRPISGEEPHIEEGCATLAAQLSEDVRYFSGLQLAARLRSDSIDLSKALRDMGFEDVDSSGHTDPLLDLLHVVRITLVQHLFLIAADLPAVTPGGAFSRDEVMEAVFSLDFERAMGSLREAFPPDSEGLTTLQLDEQADYPDATSSNAAIRSDQLIAELEKIQRLIHRITVGIANHFGAIG